MRLFSAQVKIRQILLSILKRQVNFSSNFASLFIVMTHNVSVNFKFIYFLLYMKRYHQNLNFEIFQVLWWKFSIFLISFSKPQVIFFKKILHHSSVSCNVTPLEVFSSKVTYFAQKENLKQQVKFSSNFSSIFSVMQDKSSILFSWNFIYVQQKEPLKVQIW